jgi:hypothetical protein
MRRAYARGDPGAAAALARPARPSTRFAWRWAALPGAMPGEVGRNVRAFSERPAASAGQGNYGHYRHEVRFKLKKRPRRYSPCLYGSFAREEIDRHVPPPPRANFLAGW